MSKIFTMTGRMNRAKYFWVMLCLATPTAIIQGIEQRQPDSLTEVWIAFAIVILFVSCILTICPVVQRWHDLDRPGTCYLLSFIPPLNIVLGLALLLVKGTKGPNQYGDDPLKPALPPSNLPTEDRLAKLRALHEQGLVSDEACVSRLAKLRALHEEGLVSDEVYASKQEEILRNL
jgi:uncharacterized membrane protein YhaH (DUF805 family)